ncbi:uncharacterized protein BROUX77_007640 [Berkeleyomyces rouxiae]|uniref:uncharacterized protein n=1 Tax=Berkeleyomyces rouxiae TaxID=2035830 RepID=UPI003B7C44B6
MANIIQTPQQMAQAAAAHVASASAGPSDITRDASESSKPRLPHLTPFSGKREDYRSWALNARRKLSIDGNFIGNDECQYAYLFASMTIEAQKMIVAYVERGIKRGDTPTMLLEYMDYLFIDPYAADRALF